MEMDITEEIKNIQDQISNLEDSMSLTKAELKVARNKLKRLADRHPEAAKAAGVASGSDDPSVSVT